ncbi:zinc ribbon domain-containing protein [Pseudoclavibacter sp. AY1F1]|uniref:zinc ribbon domain-containing protein n=1 Tax=Pseudoclavibacter sp. AY1F1 TaxID=2080583 RepID=UPI0011B02568|nr:zinc ribbon domain-containing protein [Pseudoclavibacter sp. AY1F1]
MATCPTCGAEAQVGQRFCAECGTKLTAGRPRASEGDGSNAAPRRPADIGAGGFRWNASAPTPPSEVVGRAREEAQQVAPPSDGDDFFARYRPKAASPSAPEADDVDGDGEAEGAAPEPQSFLRSRRRFNPDLRATGERNVVTPEAVIPPAPARPRTPVAPAEPEAPVEQPAAGTSAQQADAPVSPNATGPVRDAFAFEPPTTEFDVLPMNTPPSRSAAPAGMPSGSEDETRGQVPNWFSELEGTGDPSPEAPAAPAPVASSSSNQAPDANAAAAPQFGRPPERTDAAPAANARAEADGSVEANPAVQPQAPEQGAPRIPSFRAEPPVAPTPRVVPSPPPMPATGDPFRGASAAPVFPSGPAVVPGEPPRAAPAASSAFDELLAGERSDGSVLDDSDRPIVSRDFEQTGIVPLPPRKRESFGQARDSERRDAADLFGAAGDASATSAPGVSPAQPAGAQAGAQNPAAQAPQAPSAPEAEPATRALPRQDTGPALGEEFSQDQGFAANRGRGVGAGVAGAASGAAVSSAPDFAAPARSQGEPAAAPGGQAAAQDGQAEQDPARELLSSWFDEEDSVQQPSVPASAGTRAPRAPRRPAPASEAPDALAGAPSRTTAPAASGPVSAEPDLQPSGSNPFDRVGAALGGGSGGGGGRVGAAVRGLDNRNRRRLGVIALSVVGSILLILSAIMIGNVVGANRDDPVAGGEPSASETAAEQTTPAEPAAPAAVADPNFAPVSFTSETGNIRCQITPETGVACQQYTVDFAVPDQVCEAGATGVVVGLDSNGYTFPCLTEDIPLEGAVVQPYNSPVALGEFVCEITFETGLTCFNASGDIVSVEYSAGIGQAGRLSATNPTPAEGQ